MYKQFGTNAELEKEGVWIEYEGDTPEDTYGFLVARAGGANTKFNKVMERLTKPKRRAIQTETITMPQLEAITREVYAEAVVLGWRNIKDEAGNIIQHSKEACMELFVKLPDLFSDIQSQPSKATIYKLDVVESIVKN